jgi:hypothetical protein
MREWEKEKKRVCFPCTVSKISYNNRTLCVFIVVVAVHLPSSIDDPLDNDHDFFEDG